MPLKHDTETWLVFLLGFLTVVAGIVCMFLPPVSVLLWPWVLGFVLSLIYPFVLYPFLKSRRADNPFRLLHFAPAAIFLLWLGADLAAGLRPQLSGFQNWFTWSGGILPVALVLLLIGLFCLSVIRQWWSRLIVLGLLLLLLVGFGVFNSRYHWDSSLAAHLWGQSGSLVIGDPIGSGSTTSVDEIRWRAQLRLMEERRRAIAEGRGSSSTSSVIAQGHSSTSSTIIAGEKPPHLPHAGPTSDVLVFLTMSGFTTALHRRTIRRRRS